MRIFIGQELEIYVHHRVIDAQRALSEHHAWELRRLQAQKDDAETDRDRYRTAYRNAVKKLSRARIRGAELSRQLNNAGMLPDPDLDKGKDGAPRKLNSVQAVVDQVMTEIPGVDDAGQGAVRAYVERELRMRGIDQAEMIAAEVVSGGFLEDGD